MQTEEIEENDNEVRSTQNTDINGNVSTKSEISETSVNGGERNDNLEQIEISEPIRKRSERLPFTKPIIRFGNPLTH